uniref:Uncharacterized protein n=1 Tax=Oryza rufipogon TaxID=4529 RepID=A0A0E0Q6N3_ORYRU
MTKGRCGGRYPSWRCDGDGMVMAQLRVSWRESGKAVRGAAWHGAGPGARKGRRGTWERRGTRVRRGCKYGAAWREGKDADLRHGSGLGPDRTALA